MKILYCSDLHLDYHVGNTRFYESEDNLKLLNELKSADCDIIIIAGDLINNIAKRIGEINEFLKPIAHKIIYVPGNHDYWLDSIQNTNKALKNLNFHTLINEFITIDNVKFFGGPLWFEVNKTSLKYGNWPDFSYIDDAIQQIPLEQRNFNKVLAGADVVISHHMPTYKCVTKGWQNSPANIFFANNKDALIDTVSPKIWLHGHTHDKVNINYPLKNGTHCQILANPRGYPKENGQYKLSVINI